MAQPESQSPEARLAKTVSSEKGERPAERGWFWAILPVALIAACAELGTAILNNSTLPVYFQKGLGVSTGIYALIMIPFFVSEAIFKSPLGVMSDQYGRKTLILAGTLMTVITPFILMSLHYQPGAAGAIIVLIAFGFLRFMDGMGGAALWPALFAYVGDRVEESKRGSAMGLLNVTYMVGLALSFLAGGWVNDRFGPYFTGANGIDLHNPRHYYPSFYLASALFGIATILCVFGLRGRRAKNAQALSEEPEPEKITWKGFKESVRTIPQFIVLAFVTFLGMGCIALLVKLFVMDEFNMTEKEVGILALKPALLIAVIALPVGWLADRWGKTRSVRLGFVLCSLGLWGIPLAKYLFPGHGTGFIFAATVMGLGFVVAFPAWNALLTTLSDASRRGTVMGAVAGAQGTGVLLGSLLGGKLYSDVSHIAPFIAAAILVTIGTVIALVSIREGTSRPASPV